jgi:hypothetical protein
MPEGQHIFVNIFARSFLFPQDFEVRNVSDLTEVWLKQKLGLSE